MELVAYRSSLLFFANTPTKERTYMNVQRFVKRNASTILSVLGVAGVIATTVTAVKATPKAMEFVKKAEKEKGEKLSKWEKVNAAGVAYIPTALVGTATVACILGANLVSRRQQATLMSAYALLDRSYKDYKNKANELYGDGAGKQILEGIAKDKYTGYKSSGDDGKELFYDFYSGRYFESTKEHVMWAQYEVNRSLFVNYAVGLNEYYDLLGLEEKPEYEMLGWSCGQMEEMYGHPWIEFEHEEIILDGDSEYDEGLKCTIINMPLSPFVDYLEY